jgi:two-component system LytT family response regulator
MPNSKINILILDDEMEACMNLKNILTEYVDPELNIIGIACNTNQAEKQMSKQMPDAIFLDIEMPNENAFHFLDRISPINFEVIFVTAYDDYAIKAFKLNAIDYILKPISINELKNAVNKLKQRLKVKKLLATANPSYTDISSLVSNKTKSQRITLKDGNNIEVIEFNDIFFIEAQGSYSRIMFMKDNEVKEITMSNSLSDYEELFPKETFYRIHKSYLINCMHVKKILKDEVSQVIIRDHTLPISRRRFTPLLEFLKSNDFYHE